MYLTFTLVYFFRTTEAERNTAKANGDKPVVVEVAAWLRTGVGITVILSFVLAVVIVVKDKMKRSSH